LFENLLSPGRIGSLKLKNRFIVLLVSSYNNKRMDEYGRDFTGRVKFAVELI